VPKSESRNRRLESPQFRSIVAALLFSGVVAVTLLPSVAEFLTSPSIILFTLIAVSIAVALWAGRKVRRLWTERAVLAGAAAARRETAREISTLEEMHELPAYEPNRSAYTRKSTHS
jgi:Kef-type K+ transport system membrane component KefB